MKIKQSLKYSVLTLGLIGSFAFTGCASTAPNAGIANTADPKEEVATMSQKLVEARDANIDVLAQKEYKKAQAYLNDAKEDLKDGEKQSDILNNVRFSATYLKEAYSRAGQRATQAPGVFEARQMAIKAGAQTVLTEDMKSLDDKLADKSDKLGSLSASELSEFQSKYVSIERRAVIRTQLSKSQAIINGAKKEDAEDRAPTTLKKAELAVRNAETVISTNVRNPEGYGTAVIAANAAADTLNEVMKTFKANGKGLSETAALRIVNQNRQIAGLKSDLDLSQSNVATADAEVEASQRDLAAKDAALATASASVAIQKALEESRSKFSADEAEAYQQGENLVIRLKQVNFASGRSDLPSQSLPVLAKVSDVAKSLNATEIKVEGHTDSVGSSTINKKLSESRAEAVATYLKSNGFSDINVEAEGLGFEKPIATNKSKAGRAQNRRVDIIITPEGKTTVQ